FNSRALYFLAVFIFLTVIPLKSAYSNFVCLPNCNVNDGKMFAFSGVGLATTNEDVLELRVTSPADSAQFEIGIFDGDADNTWDTVSGGVPALLDIEIFLDPDADGTGTTSIARYSSDGSFGNNTGNPMPDNDWSSIVLSNVPGALNSDGTQHVYKLTITNLNNGISSANTFKVRSDGQLFAVAGQPFSYLILITTELAFDIIYPNIDFSDPLCSDAAAFLPYFYCDPADPSCCISNTNYDGRWDFNFLVPQGVDTLEIWDGDLDFGSASLNSQDQCDFADGVDVDSDDQNTPNNTIPPWAQGTSVNFEGMVSPTNPSDDSGCSRIISRPPSVIYSLVSPDGTRYENTNPSGDQEWELFSISTKPFDPDLYDISVPVIPQGVWRVEVNGNDLTNLNAFTLPYDLCAVDSSGIAVGCDGRVEEIPTINQWGAAALSAVFALIAIYYIRLKKRKVISKV
ncbi:MAG: hypothetical protein AAF462_07445, partial [Thermodesulfobacteriota bacterium]